MIKLFHVSKHYGTKSVLNDVTLLIEKGDMCCIVGPNGAGKSTLLKLMFCQEQSDRGQIMINNQNVTHMSQSAMPAVRQRMGFIFEDFRLMLRKTVLQNIVLALTIAGTPHKQGRQNVDRVLEALRLEHKKHDAASDLSAGEKQRVCIARAVVSDPLVLLADEPTGSLDSTATAEVFDLLRGMSARGTTVVLATQNQDVADRFPQHRVTLNQGRMTEQRNTCSI
ncbi:MAG TPA: ATP-binding cassette domain-containing protein [Nitrospirales bacterium]|nr:ATP-binding cassette domain-containing protein [Nitrospirales bacterium]